MVNIDGTPWVREWESGFRGKGSSGRPEDDGGAVGGVFIMLAGCSLCSDTPMRGIRSSLWTLGFKINRIMGLVLKACLSSPCSLRCTFMPTSLLHEHHL